MQLISEVMTNGILQKLMEEQRGEAPARVPTRQPVDMEERDAIREFNRRQKIEARPSDDHAERVAKMEAKLARRAKAVTRD